MQSELRPWVELLFKNISEGFSGTFSFYNYPLSPFRASFGGTPAGLSMIPIDNVLFTDYLQQDYLLHFIYLLTRPHTLEYFSEPGRFSVKYPPVNQMQLLQMISEVYPTFVTVMEFRPPPQVVLQSVSKKIGDLSPLEMSLLGHFSGPRSYQEALRDYLPVSLLKGLIKLRKLKLLKVFEVNKFYSID